MNRTTVRLQGVSIIVSTNRPHYFHKIIANYKRQLYPAKEMIIILNKNSMLLSQYRQRVSAYKNISVYKMAEHLTLGQCLNYASAKAKYQVIAKFDDDDYYSPYYLIEQMNALRRTGAAIVGKRAHMIYVQGRKLLIVRFHRERNRYVKYVAGGSIMFHRRVLRRVRFTRTSLGEDMGFLKQSRAKGYRIYATTPYNFVGIRRADKKTHTWTAPDEYVLKGSQIVAKTTRYRTLTLRPYKIIRS